MLLQRALKTNILRLIAVFDFKVTKERSKNDLPEIKEGDACVPGKTYKMDCNTCQCANNGELLCTKLACYDPNMFKPKLRVRIENAADLPKAPTTGPCISGIIYQNGCNTCFCDDKEEIHCGPGKCDLTKTILYPEDLREPITDEEFQALETRESFSQECTPGKTYRLNCNLCLCNELRNLICDHYACLSFEGNSVNRITAFKNIGKPCKSNQKFKVKNTCVTCTCVNGKSECKWQASCKDKKYIQQLQKTIKVTKVKPEEDSCVPGGLYMLFCNRCHCMIDYSLRCTQMTCLNFSKASELKREQEDLDKQGL